ncbi:hypothetical protein SDC9_194897 [bioreactor metagenome]|uniref:Uncharacterized protein n=1 Tax=bioreactor metagenome TaxID=1076179 RepID=A0A645I7J2_9ZZZZ
MESSIALGVIIVVLILFQLNHLYKDLTHSHQLLISNPPDRCTNNKDLQRSTDFVVLLNFLNGKREDPCPLIVLDGYQTLLLYLQQYLFNRIPANPNILSKLCLYKTLCWTEGTINNPAPDILICNLIGSNHLF